jgi:iron complex transport system ATP-binding protein
VLLTRDVSFVYRQRDQPALDRVSVNVSRGDLLGILGPNGSGKTTFLRILGGTLRPSSGSVTLDDRPLSQWSRRDIARRIAFVPQETHPPFDFTVLDLVLMGRFPHLGRFALEGPADLAIARQAMAATNTEAFESRMLGSLSGGERQRVAIASALAQRPEVLLLDEPTAALDIGRQFEIQQLLTRLNREHDMTMVLSTHDLNFAATLCRRLVLIRDGRVLADGSTDDVLTAAHVRALYDVDADVHRHPRAGHMTITPIGRV